MGSTIQRQPVLGCIQKLQCESMSEPESEQACCVPLWFLPPDPCLPDLLSVLSTMDCNLEVSVKEAFSFPVAFGQSISSQHHNEPEAHICTAVYGLYSCGCPIHPSAQLYGYIAFGYRDTLLSATVPRTGMGRRLSR